MKRLFKLLFFLLIAINVKAQEDVIDFLKAGPHDASLMIRSYLEPYAISLGDGLNNGWYTTAKSHKKFGFDISVNVSAVKIPGSAKTFDINQLALQNTKVEDGASGISPTVTGAEEQGPKLGLYYEGTKIATYYAPPGIDQNYVPVPMVQVGFGLIPHTDLIGRYVPKMEFGSGDSKTEIGLFGLGVKHNFKEWIPGFKHLPFDLAAFGGFTNITSTTPLSLLPTDFDNGAIDDDYTPVDNQELEIGINTTSAALILSKKLGPLTLFTSAGISHSKVDIDLLGKYPVPDTGASIAQMAYVFTDDSSETDPISIGYTSDNFSYKAGFMFGIGFLKLQASYNKSEYSSFNAGLAFSFR
ncbi:hypothetical protein EYV94_24010 [Puteibacter caeruleilacunae]|nr:hypothetical protein EYV94_24010 [Puteibacter caeruleilacunae]